MSKELEVVLLGLSKKLGISIDLLWSALIKQAFIDGMLNITSYISGGLALVIAVMTLRAANKFWDLGAENCFAIRVAWILLAILAFFYTVSFPFFAHDAVTAFCNPEYWALKDILCQF